MCRVVGRDVAPNAFGTNAERLECRKGLAEGGGWPGEIGRASASPRRGPGSRAGGDSFEPGGDECRGRQIGVGVGAREPVLDPQRFTFAGDADGYRPVVFTPAKTAPAAKPGTCRLYEFA